MPLRSTKLITAHPQPSFLLKQTNRRRIGGVRQAENACIDSTLHERHCFLQTPGALGLADADFSCAAAIHARCFIRDKQARAWLT
jgi:hypothetical protein